VAILPGGPYFARLMNIDEAQKNWDELGKTDPMWAVLSDPEKKGGKWDPVEFFQTGVGQIDAVFAELESLKIPVAREVALDFGCGVGRLTQALAGRFTEAHGVDIAPSMVEQAQRFNRFPDRCHYYVNSRSDLTLLGERRFDFICSYIALQHIEPRYAREYLKEFLRLLRPGGVLTFQLLEPTLLRSLVPRFIVALARRVKHASRAYLPAFGIREKAVTRLIRDAGCNLLKVRREPTDTRRWMALTFIVSKPGAKHAPQS
jgi:SAM-dependent methyltransferase